MFIVELIFEVIVYIIVEVICYTVLGVIGASVRWLFFQAKGKPRTMKELRTRVRKLKKRGKNTDDLRNGYTFGDVLIGMIVLLVVAMIIMRFSK